VFSVGLAHDLDRMCDFWQTDMLKSEKRNTQTGIDQAESPGAAIGGNQVTGAPGAFSKLL
jgi:hypothetical protein